MKTEAPSPALMTAEQIGRALGTTKKTVFEWYHEGKIPAEIAEGRTYRFDLDAVKSALKKRAEKSA
jgi:excisionase family DNA binding protein